MDDKQIADFVHLCLQDLQKAREMLSGMPALVDVRTSIDETPLSLLLRWYEPEECSVEHLVEAMRLLIASGADVNAYNACGSNPLHNAIRSGVVEAIKVLLENGAIIEPPFGFMEEKTLHIAVESGDVEIMTCLLEKGAQIDAKNGLGQTPLHYASSQDENAPIVELLLRFGADPNAADEFGDTPLDEALSEGALQVAVLLKKYGARSGHER